MNISTMIFAMPVAAQSLFPLPEQTGVSVKHWMKQRHVGECLPLCDGSGDGFQTIHWEECKGPQGDCNHMSAEDIKNRHKCSAPCMKQCSLDQAHFASLDYKPWFQGHHQTGPVPDGTEQWMRCASNEGVPATCRDGTWTFEQGSCKKSCHMSDQSHAFELHHHMRHGHSGEVKCKIPQQTQSECNGLKNDYVWAECQDGHLEVKFGQCNVPCEHTLIKTVWGAESIECIEGYELMDKIQCNSWSDKASIHTSKGTEDVSKMADYCKLKCQVSEEESLVTNFEKYARFATHNASPSSYNNGHPITVSLFDKTFSTICNNGVWEMSPVELESLEHDFYNHAIVVMDRIKNMEMTREFEDENEAHNKLVVDSNDY